MPLTAAAEIYRHAVSLRSRAYERGLFAVHGLDAQVVSVGALEAAGAGRTLTALLVARLLEMDGRRVAILHRGGPEAALLSRRAPAGVQVYSGGDRVELGRRAVAGGADAIVIDDGFQYRRLRRDADIVLVRTGLYNQRLLPAGTLREPLASLDRASLVLDVTASGTRPYSRQAALQAPAGIELAPRGLSPWAGPGVLVSDGELLGVSALVGRRVGVVTSVAHPHRVSATVSMLGGSVVDLNEHRPLYGRLVVRGDYDLVVTTEVDLLSLDAYDGPRLVALRLDARISHGEPLFRRALSLVGVARPRAASRRREAPAHLEPLAS